MKKAPRGWTVFILNCADGTYYSGMTRNLARTLLEINVLHKGTHVSKHPEALPMRTAYAEHGLPFREAYAKKVYLGEMKSRRLKKKLIDTGEWPVGGALLEYIKTAPIEELEP